MKRSQFIILLLLAACLVSCGESSAPKPAPVSAHSDSSEIVLQGDTKGLRTITVERKQIPDYLDLTGRIQADPTKVVRIFAPVGGRVATVQVRPGDRVRKGQTVALLQSSDVSSARADYLKARADAELKEKALSRASILFENQVLSEKEFQQASAEAEMAKAELERARDRLRVLGVSPEGSSNSFAVIAPRAGIVLDVGAAPGEFSKSLDAPAPICTIADLSTIWAVGDIYERDMASLKPGTPVQVTVSAYADEKLSGRVAAISGSLDPVTRTQKLRVVLANPGERLKPEMFASIRLLRSTATGIVIPTSAVLREGAAAYVFVQKAPSHFERRQVTPGRATDGEVTIFSGLNPGETIVAEGALLLRAAS